MGELLKAGFETAKWFAGTVVPQCKEALNHPLFRIITLPASIIGGIKIAKTALKFLWNKFADN